MSGIIFPLHFAIKDNDEFLLLRCIQNKHNINIQDYNGNTPLHLAYKFNIPEFISILLKNGADNNILNNDNKKPSDII